MWSHVLKKPLLGTAALLALVALLATACGGGVSQDKYDALQSQLQEKEAALAKAEAQAGGTIVQTGKLQPASAGEALTGWQTEYAQRNNIKLLATFDSSGEPAWDPSEHPTVFITTSGPGYGGFLSENKLPGLAIIDADTYEVVAYRHYDLGYEEYFEDHGLGVSPDGRWIYLPTGDIKDKGDTPGRTLVIDARTLKLHQIIGTHSVPHHFKSYVTPAGEPRVLGYDFNWQVGRNYMRPGSGVYAFDPANENRVVGGINADTLQFNPYLAFPSPDGKLISIGLPPGPIRDPDIRHHLEGAWVMVDAETWQPVDYIKGGYDPIWTAWTADGKTAYLCDGGSDEVFKYDVESKEVVASTRSAVHGMYGCHLNWDETQLWTIEKGEASHNRGKNIGLVDAKIMRAIDNWNTGWLRADHGTLHPDPERHELWVTANSSFEVVVWDMENKDVVKRIPMPMGTSTHSGAFVRYNPDFSREVEADQAGLHNSARQRQRQLLASQ
ncbi:MAG: YncE family protein [Dehalococcoidia bacterium]